jgi:hypothetical protein
MSQAGPASSPRSVQEQLRSRGAQGQHRAYDSPSLAGINSRAVANTHAFLYSAQESQDKRALASLLNGHWTDRITSPITKFVDDHLHNIQHQAFDDKDLRSPDLLHL